ncbi:hypothetical protein [Epilithonimonas sp.]|uniref:hypothetical protein n=1 Tax=Epilithonimonas sp. TaxID=2894511 RepID=UPI0028994314|nr:hypothetical protein [Epilithonimonas sp.]
MKKLILLSIFTTSFLFAQESAENIPSQTVTVKNNKPIPYARAFFEDKPYFKNTDKKGRLKLEKGEKISKITAIGFEDLFPDNNQKEFVLKSKEDIEKTSLAPKNKLLFTIGKADKNSVNYMVGDRELFSKAEYIPYKADYSEISFIKIITFLSSSLNGKTRPVILRFYKNDNGKPGAPYGNSGYVVNCKPGKTINKVDVSDNGLVFPKEGLFLGFEWINIPLNIVNADKKALSIDKNKSLNGMIEPNIALEKADDENNDWYLSSKGWLKQKYGDNHYKISFEMVISD